MFVFYQQKKNTHTFYLSRVLLISRVICPCGFSRLYIWLAFLSDGTYLKLVLIKYWRYDLHIIQTDFECTIYLSSQLKRTSLDSAPFQFIRFHLCDKRERERKKRFATKMNKWISENKSNCSFSYKRKEMP